MFKDPYLCVYAALTVMCLHAGCTDDEPTTTPDMEISEADQATSMKCGLSGRMQPCMCEDGKSGYQSCQRDGSFASCECSVTMAQTCSDGIKNGRETEIDCGGNCAACAVAPTCSDGVKNGSETEVDCGGGDCDACVVAPTCSDGVKNGDELDVDCGGSCPSCISGIETVKETFAGNNNYACHTVMCPDGKKVLSGGFHSDASKNERIHNQNRPEGDSGWTTCFGTNVDATIYAVCADLPQHAIRTAEMTANAIDNESKQFTLTANCEAGEVLIGGGFGVEDPREATYIGVPTVIHRAGPGRLDIKFLMRAKDVQATWWNTLNAKAWAICSSAIAPTTKSTQIDVNASTAGCVLAECPADHVAIGGFNNLIDNQFSSNSSGQYWASSRPDEKGWYACYNANGQSTLVSIAMCLPTP